tara:strand:- start:1174 stop:1767 length:594 start_codon:yes stop_codon:yes gene_type:complete
MDKEKKKEYNRRYYLKNKEKLSLSVKTWREENPEKVKKYKEENRESINNYQRVYKEKNKDKYQEIDKERYHNNEERRKQVKKYRLSEEGKKKRRETRTLTIEDKWRNLLNTTLKRMGKKKEQSTMKSLGYSAYELKEHLENLFTEGMSWSNHGEWHIDHILPVSSFEKNTTPYIVNSLTNLQPLWANDNLKKSNNIL